MRALVTGAAGFVGRYLVAELLSHGYDITAFSREAGVEGVRSVVADLMDRDTVAATVRDARPEVVFHLAAQSSVRASFEDPAATLQNNLVGAANLLYALADLPTKPTVIVVGSAEEYGAVPPNRLPITEDQLLAPVSPYGVSKAAQSLLAQGLWRTHGLPTVVIRPFNHTGPGQAPAFAVPAFARQIARIEAGLQPPVMRVGNLDSTRDFTDVRDIVRAYALASERCAPGEVYNLGSGRSVRMGWILDELLRLSPSSIMVESDTERANVEITDSHADPGKFSEATGWRPLIPLGQTLRDVLDYWRIETSMESTQRIEQKL